MMQGKPLTNNQKHGFPLGKQLNKNQIINAFLSHTELSCSEIVTRIVLKQHIERKWGVILVPYAGSEWGRYLEYMGAEFFRTANAGRITYVFWPT